MEARKLCHQEIFFVLYGLKKEAAAIQLFEIEWLVRYWKSGKFQDVKPTGKNFMIVWETANLQRFVKKSH